jgi:type IV pilus assembly protein PilV
MQAVSIRTAADAKYRADAAFLADQLIGRMWADQGNLSQYITGAANCTAGTAATYANAATWLNTVASTLPGAATTLQRVQVDTTGTPPINQVTVTVCWQTAPGATTYHNHVITTRINNNG